MCEPFGRSMRAVRHREGVVDKNVAELSQRGDKSGVVLFLARMKARVLQAEDVAGLHRRNRSLGGVADTVIDEFHRPPDDARNLGGHRLERFFRITPLRPSKM